MSLRVPYDYLKSLLSFLPKPYTIKNCAMSSQSGNLRYICDLSTDLRFFKMCHSAELIYRITAGSPMCGFRKLCQRGPNLITFIYLFLLLFFLLVDEGIEDPYTAINGPSFRWRADDVVVKKHVPPTPGKLPKYRNPKQNLKSQSYQSSIQYWDIIGRQRNAIYMVFRWRAVDDPLIVVFGSFFPSSN